MAVEFKKYEGSDSTLNELGTVKSVVGKGGKLALIRKNFADPNKRVAVLLTNKAGNSAVIACSKQVSDALRAKKMTIAHLVGLNIVENDEGHNFISMPAAGAIQSFDVDKVKEAQVATEEATFLPEELIAF